MQSLIKSKHCPLKHDNGTCIPAGCYCSNVSDETCAILHNAYEAGYRVGLTVKDRDSQNTGCEFCHWNYVVMSGSAMNNDMFHRSCTARFCPNCGRYLGGDEKDNHEN